MLGIKVYKMLIYIEETNMLSNLLTGDQRTLDNLWCLSSRQERTYFSINVVGRPNDVILRWQRNHDVHVHTF